MNMRSSILRMILEWSRLGDFYEEREQSVAGDKAGMLIHTVIKWHCARANSIYLSSNHLGDFL